MEEPKPVSGYLGPNPVKVLLVEDDEDDYLITADLLSEISHPRFELEWVTNYNEALATIQQGRHDAILLDYQLGAHTGLEVLQHSIKAGCQIPIILLTSSATYEIDVAASQLGAANFLQKDQASSSALERAIRYSLLCRSNRNPQQPTQPVIDQLQQELEQLQRSLSQTTAEVTLLQKTIQQLRDSP
ncbi:MAG TPA: response regulator [Candidatus Caenarcaniphilales bacterium]